MILQATSKESKMEEIRHFCFNHSLEFTVVSLDIWIASLTAFNRLLSPTANGAADPTQENDRSTRVGASGDLTRKAFELRFGILFTVALIVFVLMHPVRQEKHDDGKDTYKIETDGDLRNALEHFSKKKTPAERCVRLNAEPKDELDLFTALELFSSVMDAPSITHDKGDRSDEEENSTRIEIDADRAYIRGTIHTKKELCDFETFEQERVRRVMARLCIVHQESISVEPHELSKPHKDIRSLIRDRREHKNSKLSKQKSSEIIPTPTVDSPATASCDVNPTVPVLPETKDCDSFAETQPSEPVTAMEDVSISKGGKLSRDDIDNLCRRLYMMGFKLDEKTLRRAIKARQGNVNQIIDDLSSMAT
ncbi:unnamed protein product [Echinostoma caproni]|uniref:UBA domain-containing protein n=1 Tax=Echinostoma caproni TaxID=27848 RepID=A0A183AZP9_9TREM|nr:unnamed protein product [Echinostoma caproni]